MNKGKAFNRHVSVIEIENSSFCNRKCSFCGNTYIDRYSQHHIMEEDVYIKFLENLREINYTGVLNFNRYNEPFAEKIILERIAMARKILGNEVTLMCFSNGDYLDADYFSQIEEMGLDILYIQDYSKETDKNIIINRLLQMKERISNSDYEIKCYENMIECRILDTTMKEACIQHRFLEKCGNPRGGMLSQFETDIYEEPCYSPSFTVVIDYNGNVMPCCNLRSDCEEHKKYILGNIKENNIVDIYFSDVALNFRNSLLLGKRPRICRFCQDSKKEWKK